VPSTAADIWIAAAPHPRPSVYFLAAVPIGNRHQNGTFCFANWRTLGVGNTSVLTADRSIPATSDVNAPRIGRF
jgi:hypothetical protein